jgi:hypothetical protein
MRSFLAVTLVAALTAASTAASSGEGQPVVPTFANETAAAGIEHQFTGGWQFMVGGGVARFDCDGDTKPDVYIAGGTSKAALFRNTSTSGGPLKFEKVESGAELDAVTGAYPLDIDSDGITDLVIPRVGEDVLMRGKGGCRFERANEAWGFDGGDAWSTAYSATWEKGATWPTLAIGTYIDRKQEDFPWGNCTDSKLYRPAADGNGFAKPIALAPSYCALSMLFTDWNRSGTPSLRVSNDREYYKGGQEQLWHVDPGKPPRLYTPEEGWKPLKIWGMGIASQDLNADGYPEYFLTSMADNKLQTLVDPGKGGPPKPSYADIAFKSGVIAQRPHIGDDVKPSTAWHAQFEDMNNDGRPDLFIAKGNVSEMPDFAMRDPNNLLLQKSDGTFVEVGDKAGVASTLTARGASIADFNRDGKLDLLVVNRNGPTEIWRNVSEAIGNWIDVSLRQDGANPDAIGAWIEIRDGERTLIREVTSGGGHVSGAKTAVHFGTGSSVAVDLRIIWPDGRVGRWRNVATRASHVVAKGTEEQLR